MYSGTVNLASVDPESQGSDPVHLMTSKERMTQRNVSMAMMKKLASDLFWQEEGEEESKK